MDIFIENYVLVLALLLPSLGFCVLGAVIKRKMNPTRTRQILLAVFSLLSIFLCIALCTALVLLGGGLEHVLPVLLLHLIAAIGGNYGI